jgi:hypothetical protein
MMMDHDNDILRADRAIYSGRLTANLTLKEAQYAIKPSKLQNRNKMLLCVLGDRMGFGKTFTSLYLMMYMAKVKFLVVLCPANLQQNWLGHIQTMLQIFANGSNLKVVGFTKDEHVDAYGQDVLSSKDIFAVVVSYNMLRNHSKRINRIIQIHRKRIPTALTGSFGTNYCGLIADEAHALRSKDSDIHNQVMVLRPLFMHFVAVSGTVFMNKVVDIESLSMLVGKGEISRAQFWKQLQTQKITGSKQLDLVNDMFNSIMIRRTVEETAGPPCFMQWQGIGLTTSQRYLLQIEPLEHNLIASNRTKEAIVLAGCLSPLGSEKFLPPTGRPFQTKRAKAYAHEIQRILLAQNLQHTYPEIYDSIDMQQSGHEHTRSAPRFDDMWKTSGAFRWLMLALVYHMQRQEKILIYCPRIHFLEAVQSCAQCLFDVLYLGDMRRIEKGQTPICFQQTDLPAVVSLFTGLGRQSEADRERNSRDFTNLPNVRVLCFSNAGTEGQTWTKANVMFTFAGLPWNNGKLHQAQHRHNRIGQLNPVRVVNVYPLFADGASNLLRVSMKEQAEKIAIGDHPDHSGMHIDVIDLLDIRDLYDLCPTDRHIGANQADPDKLIAATISRVMVSVSFAQWTQSIADLEPTDKLTANWARLSTADQEAWHRHLHSTEFAKDFSALLKTEHPQGFCTQLVKTAQVHLGSRLKDTATPTLVDYRGVQLTPPTTSIPEINSCIAADDWNDSIGSDAIVDRVVDSACRYIVNGVADPPNYQIPMDQASIQRCQEYPHEVTLHTLGHFEFGGKLLSELSNRARSLVYHVTCVHLMLKAWQTRVSNSASTRRAHFRGIDGTLPTANVIHNTAQQGEVCQKTMFKLQRMQHWNAVGKGSREIDRLAMKDAIRALVVEHVHSQVA